VRELFALGDAETLPRAEILASRVHPDDADQVLLALNASLDPAGNGRFESEYRIVRPDGSVRWVLAHGQTQFVQGNGTRRARQMFGTVMDVTERRQAVDERERLLAAERRARAEVESLNTELRRALAELEGVLDVVPIGIGIARDPECREIRVNTALARQLGVAPHDDASKTGEHAAVLPFRVVKDGQEVAPEDLIMQRAARERRALLELEYDIVHDDGKVVSLLEYAAPLLDERGEVQGAVGAFVDITERARLIAAERAARRAAEQANAVKAEFLARMSHELRTPLNAIQGHAQLLTMGVHGPITDAQRDALLRIERAERHLLSLINDVLNYARLESGRLEYQITDVRVRDLLADVVPMVEQQFSQSGITLHVDAEAHRGEDVVRADREKLTQVMLNLLSNAAKFTPSGGDVHVEIMDREDGEPSNEMLYLRVRDTGTGIARDKLETIFEPFVQLRGVYSPGAGGTGLGLTISRDLARGMGGDLRARSHPGQGATFTVALRRAGPARTR
jgi:signal transduction histidine kinase